MNVPADRINPRDREAVLTALRRGLVPRKGIHLIQVGRVAEVRAFVEDLDRAADGGASIRLLIGAFGGGKTFATNLLRAIALEKKFVVLNADLSPERRLHSAGGGQARALYAELLRNAATASKPDGGAIGSVVERFVTQARQEAADQQTPVERVIAVKLDALTELVNGFDFRDVIAKVWTAHETGNEQLKSDALRWLRGEFSTRTDARQALGVRAIVDDSVCYDHLKLLARFVRLAGYRGLVVVYDELVNLYKLTSSSARQANLEQLLRMYNDAVQGAAEGLALFFAGTPETLTDTRRGLYSYPALQTRLAENAFAGAAGVVDTGGPVIRITNLTPEDLFVLLQRVRRVHAAGDPARELIGDADLHRFLAYCHDRIGAAYFQTPRTTLKAFLDLLAVLEQKPDADLTQLLGDVAIAPDVDPESEPAGPAVAAQLASDGAVASPTPPDPDDLARFRM